MRVAAEVIRSISRLILRFPASPNEQEIMAHVLASDTRRIMQCRPSLSLMPPQNQGVERERKRGRRGASARDGDEGCLVTMNLGEYILPLPHKPRPISCSSLE